MHAPDARGAGPQELRRAGLPVSSPAHLSTCSTPRSRARRPASQPAFLKAALVAALVACGHAAAAPVAVRVTDTNGQPLPSAVVFLESPQAQAAVQAAPGVEIAQEGKAFVPAVSVVPRGTAVHFPNRDTVRHHVYSFSAVKPFELKLYIGTPSNPVTFDKAGIAVLGCNIHDHMVAWVVVVDTPYRTLSEADGMAAIDGVPPGDYRLRVWHRDLPVGAPALDQALTVDAAGGKASVQVAGVTAEVAAASTTVIASGAATVAAHAAAGLTAGAAAGAAR
jgi:plastocyanin